MVDIRVVVPAYNCPELLTAALRSIVAQDYPDRGGYLDITVVDDASTVSMAHCWADAGMPAPSYTPRFHAGGIRAAERGGELASIMTATEQIERWAADGAFRPVTDQTVVCHVCGDDALHGDDALSRLAAVYEDPDVWMTYGQYVDQYGNRGHCEALPLEAHERGDYRDRRWVTSHLRSYRLGLWRRIPPEQLIDPETGRPWFYATDFAMVFPMLEMARERARFIPDVNYFYRRHDGNVSPELYADPCQRVRGLPRLDRLASL